MPASADVSAAGLLPKHDVSESSGAFAETISIEVPDFHGLEPKLALTYSSAGGNGFVGVGWTLSGLSMIERGSKGGGAPKYNASDVFMLDGEELIAGCTGFGGTHCAKHQTYQKIRLDGNTWTIWDKDGSRSVYQPLYANGWGTFRWAIRQEIDVHGNTVNYDYKCTVIDSNCFPDKIFYNGAVVSFHTEDPYTQLRPDAISFATGVGMSMNFQRLKSISVKVAGSYVRAYGLTYMTSYSTQRSMLLKVQEFGSDVVVNASSGAVTGGSSLPATSMVYRMGDNSFQRGPVHPATSTAVGLADMMNGDQVNLSYGDFNGDGFTDMLRQEYRWEDTIPGHATSHPQSNALIYLGNANGTFTLGPYDSTSYNAKGLADGDINLGYYWSGRVANLLVGDFNGDGRSDILRQETDVWGFDGKTNIKIYLARADGSFYQGPVDYVNANINDNACGLGHVWGGANVAVNLGDFNGDGKTDIMRRELGATYASDGAGDRDNVQIFYAHSSGSGCFVLQPYDSIGNAVGLGHAWDGARVDVHIADFNGDGLADILRQDKYAGYGGPYELSIGVFFSNGDGTFTWGPYDSQYNALGLGSDWNGSWVNVDVADFNGDGKADILRQEKGSDGVGTIEVFYSLGNGGFKRGPLANGLGTLDSWRGDQVNAYVSDFNGDGLADILRQEKASWGVDSVSAIRIFYGKGDGIFWPGPADTSGNTNGLNHEWNGDFVNIHLGDFNGDGKTDILRQEKGQWATDTWRTVEVYLQPKGPDDLLLLVSNGIGGVTSIEYTPSTAWSRTYMPVGSVSQTVASVTVHTGHGNSDKTTYSYYNANWSDVLRRPLGFGLTQETASDGSYVQTYHMQTPANPGVPYAVINFSSTGQYLHYNYKGFSDPTAAPYAPLLQVEQDMEMNGSLSAYRTKRKEFFYDAYANVYAVYDHGDYTLAGDEVTTYSWHYPNIANYVVDKPGFVNTYAGIGFGGAVIAQTLNQYDGNANYYDTPTKGNLTTVHETNFQVGIYHTSTYGYDAYGNQIRATDPAGRVSATTYSDPSTAAYPNVYPVKVCADPNGLNHCSSTTWDVVLGLPVDVRDANNGVARTGYDVFGRKTSQTDMGAGAPGPNVTTWYHFGWGESPWGQGVQEIRPDGSPNGLWTNAYFDGLGRHWHTWRESVTDTAYIGQNTIYKGATSLVSAQSHWYLSSAAPVYTSMEYDALGRLTKTINPDGSLSSVSYANDAAGKPYARAVGEMGQETAVWSDADGNATVIREKNGTAYYWTRMEYDLLGRKTKVTDALNNIAWSGTYNSLGHKLSEFDPNRGNRSYTYDAAGQLLTEKDAKNQVTTLVYDALGRIRTKTAGGQTSTWYYDEAGYGTSIGRNTRLVYPGGSKAQSWDIRGLPTVDTHCIDTQCRTLTTAYDGMGRARTIKYPDGEVVTHAYDASGQMVSVTGAKSYVTQMSWTASRQLASMTYGNGTVNSYTYDAKRNWLRTATAKTSAATPVTLYSAGYEYDADGRVTKATFQTQNVAAVETNYTYDELDRLSTIRGATTYETGCLPTEPGFAAAGTSPCNNIPRPVRGPLLQSFTYDAIGNITYNSKVGNYTYDPVRKHAVASAGAKTYSYDANGSMLSGAGGLYTMTWDGEERMASLTKGGVATTFGYDEGEQRVKKTVGGVAHYYFDSKVELNGAASEQYYYAGAILVARKKMSGATAATRWYHADRLGSVRVMTGETATSVKEYDYEAFGDRLSKSGSEANERGYTGHVEDDESGLVYMNARYYDAEIGRFVSADSIVGDENNPQDYNRYSYVNNNPINNTDPTGHMACPAIVCDALSDAWDWGGDFVRAITNSDAIEDFIDNPTSFSKGLGAIGAVISWVPAGRIASVGARSVIRIAEKSKGGKRGTSRVSNQMRGQITRVAGIIERTAHRLNLDSTKVNKRRVLARELGRRAGNFAERAAGHIGRAISRKGTHGKRSAYGAAARNFASQKWFAYAEAAVQKHNPRAQAMKRAKRARDRCRSARRNYLKHGGTEGKISC